MKIRIKTTLDGGYKYYYAERLSMFGWVKFTPYRISASEAEDDARLLANGGVIKEFEIK